MQAFPGVEVQPVGPATEAVVRRFLAFPMNIGEGFRIEAAILVCALEDARVRVGAAFRRASASPR